MNQQLGTEPLQSHFNEKMDGIPIYCPPVKNSHISSHVSFPSIGWEYLPNYFPPCSCGHLSPNLQGGPPSYKYYKWSSFSQLPNDFGPSPIIPIKTTQYQVLWIWIHTHHTRIWLDPHRWFGLPLWESTTPRRRIGCWIWVSSPKSGRSCCRSQGAGGLSPTNGGKGEARNKNRWWLVPGVLISEKTVVFGVSEFGVGYF